MTAQNTRSKIIANLRAMADLFEQHENLPVPYSISLSVYPDSLEAARVARKGTSGWCKETAPTSGFVDYTLPVGGFKFEAGTVNYSMYVTKSDACRRVQVGTKHVEAYDVPVYEWDCKQEL